MRESIQINKHFWAFLNHVKHLTLHVRHWTSKYFLHMIHFLLLLFFGGGGGGRAGIKEQFYLFVFE